MKRIIFLFLLFTSSALSQPLCTVSGTISNYNLSGYSIRTGLIKELRRSGVIVPYRDAPITVSTTGQVRFQVPQTVGTDTTKIRIYLPAPGWTGVGDQGVWVAIPHGATATLNSLVSVPYVAPAYPVVTPTQLFFDSTGNTIFSSDTLWLGAGLAAVPKGAGSNDYAIINTSTGTGTVNYGDSIWVADSLARYAVQQAALALTRADSARLLVIARIEADIDTLRARADTAGAYDRVYLYTAIGRLYDSLGVIVSQLSALGSRVDTVGSAARAAIEAHNASQDVAIAAAGKWETYESGGTYRVGVPKWTSPSADSAKAKIDNAGKVSAARMAATEFSSRAQPSSGLYFTGSGGETRIHGVTYNLHKAPSHLFYDWNGNPILTAKPDSLTFYKPQVSLGGLSVYAGNFIIDNDGAGPSKAAGMYFGIGGGRIYTSYYGVPYWYFNKSVFWGLINFRDRVAVGTGSTTYDEIRYAFNLFGNLGQVKDSLADLGRVRTPRVIWDTLGVQQSDTLRYWVESVKEPKSIIYQTSGAYPATKQGSVTFVIPADMQLGPVTGMFLADSANGVYIQQIRQRGVGGRAGLNNGANYRAEIDESVDISHAANAVNWGSTSNSEVPRLRGTAANPGNFTRPFSVMGVSGNAADAYGLITVEVTFIMASTSNSSWYVTIANL